MVGVGVGAGVYVGSTTGVSVGLMVARSGVMVGAGTAAGVSDEGDTIVLVGAGVSANSEKEGGASSSPGFSDPKIAMMMASTMKPTNPTPAHLSAFLNLRKDLPPHQPEAVTQCVRSGAATGVTTKSHLPAGRYLRPGSACYSLSFRDSAKPSMVMVVSLQARCKEQMSKLH